MKGIWNYKHLLPKVSEKYQISIGEGNTPLVRSRNIGPSLGLNNLYFKLENLNPTGSYKDRFAALAVSILQEKDAGICLATSSGNTGAALAAYSAVAKIQCLLAIVDGAPEGKLAQMQSYGAQTLMIKNFGKDVGVTHKTMTLLKELSEKFNSDLHISAFYYSPVAMQGVQTIAYEIAEKLTNVKTQVFIPAGGGGLTLAICKGFERWAKENPGYIKPIINCVQPEGNDTIASSLRDKRKNAKAISCSTTSVSGLQVPNLLDGNEVVHYCSNNDGMGHVVNDKNVFLWQHRMALEEGIFCEPAGAVALAGLENALRNKEVDINDDIICLVTGHGFKDPQSVQKMAQKATQLYMQDVRTFGEYIENKIK